MISDEEKIFTEGLYRKLFDHSPADVEEKQEIVRIIDKIEGALLEK